MIVEVHDGYDVTPTFVVVTDDEGEVAKLRQRAAQYGYEVIVRNPDPVDTVWRFFDQLGPGARREQRRERRRIRRATAR